MKGSATWGPQGGGYQQPTSQPPQSSPPPKSYSPPKSSPPPKAPPPSETTTTNTTDITKIQKTNNGALASGPGSVAVQGVGSKSPVDINGTQTIVDGKGAIVGIQRPSIHRS